MVLCAELQKIEGQEDNIDVSKTECDKFSQRIADELEQCDG
jgi:hypothetical protein